MIGYLRSKGKSQSGFLVVTTLYTMLLIACAGVAIMLLSKTELQTAYNFCDGIAVQHISEAGIRRAVLKLIRNQNWQGCTDEILISTGYIGQYQVFVKYSSVKNIYEVISIGKINQARRLVRLTLQLEKTSNSSADNTPIITMLPKIIQWRNYYSEW